MHPLRAKQLFTRALEFCPEERPDFVRAACGGDEQLRVQVEGLLRAHDKARDFLREPEPSAMPAEAPGTRIGDYRLVEVLGEGGFATVWLAEQEAPLRRRVALKIVKAGMDTARLVQRFAIEQAALAMMDHPDIARVFDAGTTASGRPYFVMELVLGAPITTWCRERGVDLAARLRLFERVCLAVQHAHQKGVIHRDLKPSNVLVTLQHGEPSPKVIDFGIAKALHQDAGSEAGERLLGTPEYMAPEQMAPAGDADTRADVYSLGALLYELLTGEPPFDVDALLARGELLRHVREVAPPRPSAGGLRRELDWIVARAMAKDRAARYASASDLANDVASFLADRPLAVAPARMGYRLALFVRRNRVLVAGMVLAALSLLGGLLAALVSLDRARRAEAAAGTEAARAQQQAQRLAAVQDFLQREMLGALSPRHGTGAATTVREVLDRTAASLRGGAFARVPEVEADLCRHVGLLYRELGQFAQAEAYLRQAIAVRAGAPSPVPADVGADLVALAHCLLALGGEAEAGGLIDRGMQLCAGVPEAAAALADLHLLRGFVARAHGRLDAAQAEYLSAEAIFTAPATADRSRQAAVLHNLADLASNRGDRQQALALFERALAILRQLHGDDHIRVARCEGNVALVLMDLGDLAGAERRLQRQLEVCERELPGDNVETALALHNLASVRHARGDAPAALELARRAAAMFARALGRAHYLVANSTNDVGGYLETGGDLDGAEASYREALAIYDSLPHAPADLQATTCFNLASCLRKRAAFAEAAALFERAVAGRRRFFGADHERLAEPLYWLADVRRAQGDVAGAEAAYREAVRVLRGSPAAAARLAGALAGLGTLLVDRGEEAERLLRESLELRRGLFAADHWLLPYGEAALGRALLAQGRLDEAGQLLGGAIDRLQPPPDLQLRRLEVLRWLVDLCRGKGDAAAEARWRAEADALAARLQRESER